MTATGLVRHYTMGQNVVRAIDGVDVHIGRGEFVMVVGSSGSGKSTLLHLLGCLDTPDDGNYLIDGKTVSDIADGPLSSLRNKHIGFIFQQFNLLNELTVLENIALPLVYSAVDRTTRLARARKYAELMGLGDRVHHRPSELSGGEAQRVAIARALVTDPDMILADEPTGNLDSATGRDIMDILHGLHDKGYTIVMVTHDTACAEEGTRKIVFKDGKIITDVKTAKKMTRSQGVAQATSKPSDAVERHGMPPLDLLRIGFREGLLTHKTQTALTMLGIVIAVAGVIAMSSFSLGSKKKQADQVRALGANLVKITDNQLEGEKLSKSRIAGSHGLRLSDVDLLKATVPGVKLSAAVREIKMNIAGTSLDINPRILGVAGDYLQANHIEIDKGRFFDAYDNEHCARVAVLGYTVAEAFGEDCIGKSIVLGGSPYTIIGTTSSRQIDLKGLEATGVQDPDLNLLIPLSALLARTKFIDMRSEIDEIHLQLETEDLLYDAGTAIRRVLTVEHGGEEDFSLVVPLDLLKQKQQAQRLLDVLTICISSIALIVGGIGIMNIMLASVTERIREIGIRRAAGATKSDIKYQFLSESVLISVMGGIIGIIVALVVVAVVCAAISLPFVVSPFSILLSVLAATITGLGFGLYPAMQAAEKNPVEALRHE